ncbi:hypothetical protein D9615_010237 [Tricholomella constricta]|uniref:F-box domain-containing protein n=1 Tax=Tricholomella constricta TaxID=117010 RepID=A0A8H5GQX9_9AGAR|nr:hypothetical protein D9615_010237 [Tricholomella constricta]
MLLRLPPEIIVRILCFLDLAELVSIIQAHPTLHEYFKAFPILQYRFATQAAQVEDNPRSTHGSVVAERLALLNSREQGWARLNFDFQKTISVQHRPTGIYDLMGGVYLLGDESRRALHYCKLPSTPSDPVSWSSIDVDCTLIDVGLNVYEHDLIAVVTTQPHPTNRLRHILALQLLQFSTGKPHPRARSPVLFVSESHWPRPSIGIEIVGSHLALVTTHFLNPLQPRDRFYVFEWQTGALKMVRSPRDPNEVHAPNHTYASVVFLSPTLLLLPNTRTAALDVWAIPAGADADEPTHPLVTLALPPLALGYAFVTLASRGEPNPATTTTTTASPRAPAFATAPEEALILLTARVRLVVLGFGIDTERDAQRLVMLVRRGDVLRVVRRAMERAGLGVLDEVGRALVVDSHAVDVDAEGFGEGGVAAGVGGDAGEDGDAGEGTEGEGEQSSDGALPQDQGHRGGDANANSITPASLPVPLRPTHHVPWPGWGPPMTRWMTTAGTPTRWITTSAGTRCVLRAKPRREDYGGGGGDEDEGEEGEEEGEGEGLRVLDFNPMVVRQFSAAEGTGPPTCTQGVEGNGEGGVEVEVVTRPSTLVHPAFEDPVQSALPYVSFTRRWSGGRRGSGFGLGFEGVLMDEERLVGLRTDPEHQRVVEIEVMHIGWTGTGAA